ncbi:OsmC family protein [Novosphingobium sp. G106]|uniref:OsmC family protein n=1 Tax=Novosphingobium sp. G106 TaxID=2849500 RepID=UPI0020C5037A|nr:OsmC family protein [Novosphingobium sp. G106]
MTDVMTRNVVNGLDLEALNGVVGEIQQDASKALVRFSVATRWTGQTGSKTTVKGYEIAGEQVAREFEIEADEPHELLGTNQAPNPQELLMAAVNACMTVGYVAGASLRGITLSRLEIDTTGQLDLRGFLGLDDGVPPGYEQIDYTVRIAGDGTPEQFDEIHAAVMKTSPNYFNIARPIRMNGKLQVS